MNPEPDMWELRAEMERIFGEEELDRILALDHVELQAYLARMRDEEREIRAAMGEDEYQRQVFMATAGSVQ